jgi:hypothetical protein
MVQNAAIQMGKALFIPSYTGVQGHLNVYNPQVEKGNSAAQIYMMNGPKENSNIISTGWMVKLFDLGLQ